MIGRALKDMRGRVGQAALARDLGISKPYASKIENDRADPRVSLVSRWIERTGGSWAQVAEAFDQPIRAEESELVKALESELLESVRQKARSVQKLGELLDEFACRFWAALNDDSRMNETARDAVREAMEEAIAGWDTDQKADSIDNSLPASSVG